MLGDCIMAKQAISHIKLYWEAEFASGKLLILALLDLIQFISRIVCCILQITRLCLHRVNRVS